VTNRPQTVATRPCIQVHHSGRAWVDATAKTWVIDDQLQVGNAVLPNIPMAGTVDILAFDIARNAALMATILGSILVSGLGGSVFVWWRRRWLPRRNTRRPGRHAWGSLYAASP
jgi:hypothetical protein